MATVGWPRSRYFSASVCSRTAASVVPPAMPQRSAWQYSCVRVGEGCKERRRSLSAASSPHLLQRSGRLANPRRLGADAHEGEPRPDQRALQQHSSSSSSSQSASLACATERSTCRSSPPACMHAHLVVQHVRLCEDGLRLLCLAARPRGAGHPEQRQRPHATRVAAACYAGGPRGRRCSEVALTQVLPRAGGSRVCAGGRLRVAAAVAGISRG